MLSLATTFDATARSAVESLVTSAAETVGDSLSFSKLLASSGTDDSQSTDAEQIDSLTRLQESLQQQLAQFQQAISQRLRTAGIPLDKPLALEYDARGDLRVDGIHASANQIELLLSDDALRQQAAELHSLQAEVHQREIAQRAEHLREIDPRAAADLQWKAQRGIRFQRVVVGG